MEEKMDMPNVEISRAPEKPKQSPLDAYYRQPKIYMRLPSSGKFYPEGSIDPSQDGQYAVYSMTAKDELMLKTPDALLTGRSTVEVIQSCVPSIKDAWQIPSIDLDAILVGIRIATYGETMDIDTECPKCKEEQRYGFDLTKYLEELAQFSYTENFAVGELIFHLRPFTYKEATRRALSRIEQEKIFSIINDDKMDDEEKIERFGVSFVKLSNLTVDMIAEAISQIDTPQGSESDKDKIRDFMLNTPKDIFEAVNEELLKMKESLDLKVKGAKCDKCEHVFDIAVAMDQANFFNARS